jgi:hypothetical protein
MTSSRTRLIRPGAGSAPSRAHPALQDGEKPTLTSNLGQRNPLYSRGIGRCRRCGHGRRFPSFGRTRQGLRVSEQNQGQHEQALASTLGRAAQNAHTCLLIKWLSIGQSHLPSSAIKNSGRIAALSSISGKDLSALSEVAGEGRNRSGHFHQRKPQRGSDCKF